MWETNLRQAKQRRTHSLRFSADLVIMPADFLGFLRHNTRCPDIADPGLRSDNLFSVAQLSEKRLMCLMCMLRALRALARSALCRCSP